MQDTTTTTTDTYYVSIDYTVLENQKVQATLCLSIPTDYDKMLMQVFRSETYLWGDQLHCHWGWESGPCHRSMAVELEAESWQELDALVKREVKQATRTLHQVYKRYTYLVESQPPDQHFTFSPLRGEDQAET